MGRQRSFVIGGFPGSERDAGSLSGENPVPAGVIAFPISVGWGGMADICFYRLPRFGASGGTGETIGNKRRRTEGFLPDSTIEGSKENEVGP